LFASLCLFPRLPHLSPPGALFAVFGSGSIPSIRLRSLLQGRVSCSQASAMGVENEDEDRELERVQKRSVQTHGSV
jgi:hypothetical protein